jgi:hypothetical protein
LIEVPVFIETPVIVEQEVTVYETVPVVKIVEKRVPYREEVIIEKHVYSIVEVPVEIETDGQVTNYLESEATKAAPLEPVQFQFVEIPTEVFIESQAAILRLEQIRKVLQ